MLERIEFLVFYFVIECANCHNESKVSHVVVEEQVGQLVCSLCGKAIAVPNWEKLVASTKDLNTYLGDSLNSKFVKIELNPKFVVVDEGVAAH